MLCKLYLVLMVLFVLFVLLIELLPFFLGFLVGHVFELR